MIQRNCIQIAIGLAVSGGAVILLGGNALADSTAPATLSQGTEPSSVTLVQPVATPTSTAPSLGTSTDPTAPSNSQSLSNGAKTPSSPSTTDDSTNFSSSSSQPSSSTITGIGQSGGSDSDNSGGSSSGQTTSKSLPVPTDTSGTSGLTSTTLPTAPQDGDHPGIDGTASPTQAQEVTVVAPVVTPSSPSSGQPESTTTYRDTVMPIQPIITTQMAPLADDLAATVPSAPATPNKAPAGTKSNGFLAGLTAQLAATVVPQPALSTGIIFAPIALSVTLLTLVALLLDVFSFSYGQWLRRGGFVTAARSDEPNSFQFSVATPIFLSYVTLPPQLHSSILVVAETNILNKPLSPMLTERRISR